MTGIDWPLAIVLLVMFVVMSTLRWRYFKRRMARSRQVQTAERTTAPAEKGTPT